MRILRLYGLSLFLLACTLQPVVAAEPGVPTQRDWMSNLVDTLNLAFGLPDQPSDDDYIKLLDGRREYRFEAEDARNPNDLVAINCFNSYGPFSGSGWLCGLSTPTKTSFQFLLPRGGNYRFTVSVRLAGHVLRLGDQTFHIDTAVKNDFHRVDLGEVRLTPGLHTLEIDLPPNGSIDYFEFIAPPFPPVAPTGGWQPDQPLNNDDVAVTSARLLGLEPLLPPVGERLIFEAEEEPGLDKGLITDQQHLGVPSGGRWIRNSTNPLELVLHFSPKQAGVYDVLLRGASEKGLSGVLNERFAWSAPFPSYLGELSIGSYILDAAPQTLRVQIPPHGGIDTIILRRRLSSDANYRMLLGLSLTDNELQLGQINRLLLLLGRLAPQND